MICILVLLIKIMPFIRFVCKAIRTVGTKSPKVGNEVIRMKMSRVHILNRFLIIS